jgi:cytochrome c-type biogenesis protein CcmH/NrfG
VDVYLRLAKLYMSTAVANNQAAVDVLNKAINVDPKNADVFLQLGVAQRALGNKSAAVMAWQKYLDLAPTGDMAQVVKDGIKQLSETTTTTAASSTSTSAPGSSSTTTGSTTTTTSAPTTTTAAQ